ncbi:SGNH/GDSL hydrolase family protein [Spiroplasma endosymbiont of Dilophus febrilis]|uniref:SGNH/GDSL hydrolase family protein n=1 Tax=Spiroplasma endosymbiont of Dilophus febrilis TaxID=3066292 RepID=UPI00313C518B
MLNNSKSLLSLFLLTSLITTSINLQNHNTENQTKNQTKYNQIYALGDSLSDNGALVDLVNTMLGKIPSFLTGIERVEFQPPFYGNSFSNGPVAVEVLANKLNLSLSPAFLAEFKISFLGWKFQQLGNNYSTGAAQVIAGTSNNKFGNLLQSKISLTKQTTALLTQHKIKSNDLVVIILGANDFVWVDKIDDALIDNVVQRQEENLRRLIASNAQRIVIGNLPDIADTPIIKERPLITTEVIKKYNQKLAIMVNKVNKDFANYVKLYDLFTTFKKIANNFLLAGKETKKGCSKLELDGFLERVKKNKGDIIVEFNDYCNLHNIDNFLFFDQVHPTKNAHYQLGMELFNIVKKW